MLIAITGGIGSGKSIVCRILSSLGFEIYDTDSRAKTLMENSPIIKQKIRIVFGNDIITDGHIDRPRLANIVFNDKHKLNQLNSIVHSSVIDDIREWLKERQKTVAFVETALLYESGLDKLVNQVWNVTAPTTVRIQRVMRRNNMARQQVMSRIQSQQCFNCKPHPLTFQIVNNDINPVLPQVTNLLDSTLRLHETPGLQES